MTKASSTEERGEARGKMSWLHDPKIQGYILGIAAAAAYGLSTVLIRQGVFWYGAPLTGTFISLVAGMVVLGPLNARGLRKGNFGGWKGLLYLSLAGFFAAAGVYTNYLALRLAPVTVVQPLTATNPLFTLFLARIFLPAEKITPRLILGVCLVIFGVAVIGFSRTH